jgi:hypothetical protein
MRKLLTIATLLIAVACQAETDYSQPITGRWVPEIAALIDAGAGAGRLDDLRFNYMRGTAEYDRRVSELYALCGMHYVAPDKPSKKANVELKVSR